MAKSLSTSGQTVSHCAGPGTGLGHRFIYQLVHTLSSIRTLHLALMLPNAFKSQNLLNAASCECPLFAMRSQYILDDIVLKIETFF